MTLTRSKPLRRSTKKGKPTKRSTEKNRADKLWSAKVKAEWAANEDSMNGCELWRRHSSGQWGAAFVCGGPLQSAHGFSRRYGGTRFLPINGFALCRSAHVYFTHHPLEWDAVLRAEWGETVYEELRQTALNFTGPLDYRLIADALR